MEYLSPQGVLLPLVYGTTASPLWLELRGHSAWQVTPSWTVYRLACHRLLPWLRVTFAMVPDAAWPGSDQWPWSTAPATGPVGRLGRPSASVPWGIGSALCSKASLRLGGGSGKPKRVLNVLSAHAQAVLMPSQGHLVDHLCGACGDSRGPLAIRVSQKVEDDIGVHCMDPLLVDAVLQGEGGGHSLAVGHRARYGHCSSAGDVSSEGDTGGVPARSALRRVGGGVAPGLREPVAPGGTEPPCFEVGGSPSDVGEAGGQRSHVQRPGVVGADCRVVVKRTSAPAIVLAQDLSAVTLSLSHAGPPCWCTTRCPVFSGWSSSVCTSMCGLRGTSVATSRVVPQGSPRGLGWPASTCTITPSAQSCACSVARAHWSSVVTNHTGVGTWGRGRRGSGQATSALGSWFSPSASTSRRMYRRAVGGWYVAPCVGGIGCPDGSSPRRGGAGCPRSPAGQCGRPA